MDDCLGHSGLLVMKAAFDDASDSRLGDVVFTNHMFAKAMIFRVQSTHFCFVCVRKTHTLLDTANYVLLFFYSHHVEVDRKAMPSSTRFVSSYSSNNVAVPFSLAVTAASSFSNLGAARRRARLKLL